MISSLSNHDSEKKVCLQTSFPYFCFEKEAPFEDAISKIVKKWPYHFDKDFLKDYHHFLGISENEFRAHRSFRHQIRMLCSLYLMRRNLTFQSRLFPRETLLQLRLLPTFLQFPFSSKPVIGIAIAIHLSNHYECFEGRHILLAVQKLIPCAQGVNESFLKFQRPRDSLCLLYFEIEKRSGSRFFLTEINLLKQQLQHECKKCIETLVPSVFGTYNIEEVMRNILALSNQLKYLKDVPQMMISFDDQPYSRFLATPMTTVSQQSSQIGQMATKILIDLIETNKQFEPKGILLPTTLIKRNSVKVISAGGIKENGKVKAYTL